VIADESFHTARDIPLCAECFHGVNVKLAKSAGLTGAIQALRAARTAGLRTMIGCMVESSLGITAAAHLAELADYLDLDGNLLVANDPFEGVRTEQGRLSFGSRPTRTGLMVSRRGSHLKADPRVGLGALRQDTDTRALPGRELPQGGKRTKDTGTARFS
jgi:L-alanine-DL-glutamate epimerase-like enolase superfamily enzyme